MTRTVVLSVEALDPQLTGVGRYVWELTQRLPAEPSLGTVRFIRNGQWIADPAQLLIPRRSQPDGPPPKRPKYIRWLRKRRESILQVRDRWIGKRSICHGPNFFLPAIAESGVITIHDLSVFRYPETHPAARLAQFEREFKTTLARTAHIITVSGTIRAEVIAFTGFAPEKVSTIYQGVAPNFHPRPNGDLTPVLAAYDLKPGEYALCVSTIEPRKRIAELVRAWQCLPLHVRGRWPLVLAGSSGWLSDSIFAEMKRGERDGWLRYIRYVDEGDLPSLYAGARLFVYPSIYEGFGLPPVEAMASGVPVVVANISCLPEVTGGAAMLGEPDDIEGFALDLERGLVDEGWRRLAIAEGLQVAKRYRWDRCAQETAALYGNME